MKPKYIIMGIITFGVLFAFLAPQYTKMALEAKQNKQNQEITEEVAQNTKIKKITNEQNTLDLAYVPVAAEATVDTRTFDGMNEQELTAKLNRSLKGYLAGKGNIYAKYSLEYGVDPYLAVAISLHETGCNWKCSSLVRTKNNVGGLFGKGGALSFGSLDEGIRYYIYYIKQNYVAKGKTKAIQMEGYAANVKTWSSKVNTYYNKVKNA